MTQQGLFGGNYRPARDKQPASESQSRLFADGAPFVEDQPANLLPMMQQQYPKEKEMDDRLEPYKAFAMQHYDTWGHWEIECNEPEEWHKIADQYPATPEGLKAWKKFSLRIVDAREEAGGAHEAF